MTYTGLLTIRNEEGQLRYERSLSADEVVDFLLGPRPEVAQEQQALKKRQGRPKSSKRATKQQEGPAIRTTRDREEVKRLLLGSDLSPKEIAEKCDCSSSYVYMIRNAMQRNGELPDES